MRPGSDPIGLIDVPETETAGPARGAAFRVVVAVFFASIGGTALVDTFDPLPPPQLVGREAAEEQRLRDAAHVADGSLARWIERDRRLRSRVRDWVMDPYALVLYRYLGEAGDRIIVGRDRWLFLRDQVELPSLRRRDVEAVAEYGGALFAALDRVLAFQGVRMIALPVPRKASVCRTLLPPGWEVRQEVDRLLVGAIEGRGVPVVDLPSLYDPLDPEELYYPEGTHWTELGAQLAARETARVAGLLAPEAERTTHLVEVPLDAERQDLSVLFHVGIGLDPSRGPELAREITGFDVVRADGTVLGLQPASHQRVVVVGTSYSHSYQFSPLFEHYVQEPVGVWARPGHYTLSQLRALLQTPGELPEVLVFEEPNLDSFSTDPWPLLGEVLQDLPAPPTVPLDTGALALEPTDDAGLDLGRDGRPLARLAARRVFHTGDGLLALRIAGDVRSGAALLEVVPHERDEPRRTDFRVRALLTPERPAVVLPLVLPGPSAPHVTVEGAAMTGRRALLAPPTVELVALVDPTTRVDARPEPAVEAEGAWSLRLALPPGTVVPEQAGFLARLPADPALARRFEVVVAGPDGERATFSCAGLDGDGWLALGLDVLAGDSLEAVTLRGTGSAPGAAPAEAFLAGAAD